MTSLPDLPDSFTATRDALQRVAVHVVARARRQAGAHSVGLRVTPGGFGTPEFGHDLTRVRVSGDLLVRETGGPDGYTAAATPMDGMSLARLATFARVDLAADLDVGHDTPPLGDTEAPVVIDAAAARTLAGWFAKIGQALDQVVFGAGSDAAPTLVQLWPEHFDVALDLAVTPDVRVNVGGSPGDGFHAEPYLYVGPWTADRPGDQAFWNAPFGGFVGYAELAASADPVAAAVDFVRRGLSQFD